MGIKGIGFALNRSAEDRQILKSTISGWCFLAPNLTSTLVNMNADWYLEDILAKRMNP
jgi:hypothetical protein